jgi:hypothetical protein
MNGELGSFDKAGSDEASPLRQNAFTEPFPQQFADEGERDCRSLVHNETINGRVGPRYLLD